MVTQPGREGLVRDSVECFAQQSYVPRELVIVHDGDAKFDGYLKQLIDIFCF